MHKLPITLGLALVSASSLSAQIAVNDAKTIRDKILFQQVDEKVIFNLDTNNTVFFNSIMKNYIPAATVDAATSDADLLLKIKNVFATNPFIRVGGTGQDESSNSLTTSKRSTGLFGAIGGLDVTTLADGLAKFLVDRTKEELNIAFFERFRDLLKAHPELRAIFPATATYLNAILNFEYTNSLSVLKEAFVKDLKLLPRNIPGIAELNPDTDCNCDNDRLTTKCKERITALKTFFATEPGGLVIAALLVADGVASKTIAADIIESIYANKTIAAANNDVGNIIKLMAIMSKSIRNADATKSWITPADLRTMVTDNAWFKIYAGLVYQQIRNDNITINGQVVADLIPSNQGIINYLTAVVSSGEVVVKDLDAMGQVQALASDAKLAAIAAFIGHFRTFFVAAANYEVINPAIKTSPGKANFVLYTDRSLEITQNVLIKNYSAAVISTLILVDAVLTTRNETTAKLAVKAGADTDEGKKTLVKLEFKHNLVKYGSFMANVAAADNSDDVKKAITAIALPPGSSSIKKTHYFNVALQAYTGLAAGHMKDGGGKFFNSIGVYAPLGVSVSTGLKSWNNPYNKKTLGSLSLFASLVDVGAIVSYRFKEPGVQLSDSVKIRLENIFAPGANLVYGIPKWPVSIGGGFQWMPSLTRLSNDKATIAEKSGLRWHLFLAIDIPVLNLYSSRR